MKMPLTLLIASLPILAMAQGVQPNVMVQALREGRASMVMTQESPFGDVVRAIQKKTGDLGPVQVAAAKLLRFKQQPNCGRVVFVIAQPSSHTAWPDMGGQLNICESGSPPLRECDDNPAQLLPADAMCKDGTPPHDTPEVAAAIAQAQRAGSLSQGQVRQQLVDAYQRRSGERTKRASP